MPIETNTYRYPGTQPFKTQDAKLFFGRDNDYKELRDTISIRDMVVLYGKSGNGKSSFIQAKLIPALQKESKDLSYFAFRFKNFNEENQTISPAQEIKNLIQNPPNQDKTTIWQPFDSIIPSENSFWYWLKNYQKTINNPYHQYLFIFDQFESLFTYPKSQIDEFSNQLSQIIYGTVPHQYREKLSAQDDELPYSDDILSFIYTKPIVKILFVIREDRMASFDLIKDRHPDILLNLVHLESINDNDAEKGIVEPAKQEGSYKSPQFNYEIDAVKAIIEASKSKNDKKVNTSTLQIICRSIEDKIINGFFEKDNKGKFSVSQSKLGDIRNIVENFYFSETEKVAKQFQPNGNADELRVFLETKFIAGNISIPLYHASIDKEKNSILQHFVESSLIRYDQDSSNRFYYEIGHDSLIGILNENKQKREIRENEQKIKEAQEKQRIAEENEKIAYEKEKIAQGNEKKAKLYGFAAFMLFLIACFLAWDTFLTNKKLISINSQLDITYKVLDSTYHETVLQRDSIKLLNNSLDEKNKSLKAQIIKTYEKELVLADTLMYLHEFKNANNVLSFLNEKLMKDTLREKDYSEKKFEIKEKIERKKWICRKMIPVQVDWEKAENYKSDLSYGCALKFYRAALSKQNKMFYIKKYSYKKLESQQIIPLEATNEQLINFYNGVIESAKMVGDSTLKETYESKLLKTQKTNCN